MEPDVCRVDQQHVWHRLISGLVNYQPHLLISVAVTFRSKSKITVWLLP